MQGRLVRIEWATEDDYELIASWLKPLSPAAAMTADSREFLTPAKVKAVNEDGGVRFFMAVTRDGDRVGAVNYRSVNSSGSYSIGGVVGDAHKWSRGYGAEAFWLVIDHLFNNLNAHRVEFSTAVYNKETMSILTKGGFVLEGVLRDYHFVDGMYYDRTIWSILREEFEEHAAANRDLYPVIDAIPAEDKQAAQEMFRKYLANDPHTSLQDFEQRAARVRPY
ncbi:GNAT family N-acetyltransferase [Saccharopolyspora hordei]|uniref:RimJ/RimL family protein N-acetyltransferase n=1 Tax=Saccharopolyspora hordei TaxID=1838 RepID=A0A853AER2_9PSEU|nr:GNAT family protein [Saccharopolyspora hordei]NYI82306.1 RimJ/RimL family protein N-acetyltransferase [Saccharopolyspora hordei]